MNDRAGAPPAPGNREPGPGGLAKRALVDPATPQPEAADRCDPRRPMMDDELRADVVLRLAKAAGQVQGVSRMVTADRYCVDVLNQIAAVQKALDGVARMITRNYLERCVTDAIRGGDPLIYDELMRVLHRTR